VTEGGQKRGWLIPPALAAWIAVAITILVGVTWATSAGLLTWSMAVDARTTAQDFVSRYAIIAYFAYVALFIVMALALFPAQLWIIVFGAMVFGFWPALIVSWAAALLSAVAVFLAARGALAGKYREKAGRYLARVEQEFQRDQFSWMLAMRFVPVVPYFVSNVAPAFLGARLPPFIVAAGIGVMPYVTAYTFAGDKAASILDRDTPPDVASLAADMFPVMVAVAMLPLAALAIKRLRRKPASTR